MNERTTKLLLITPRFVRYSIILFFIQLAIACPLFSQSNDLLVSGNISIENISTLEGLSQSTVESIFMDSRGFMWFGTEAGLNRYDGYEFTSYKRSQDNPNSISNEVVFSIYEDKANNLWIGTRDGGLNKFDRATETFRSFIPDPDKNSISDNRITHIYESESEPGVLWISTEAGGLNRFDVNTETFTHFKFTKDAHNVISSNRLRTIIESKSLPGILWIATGDGGLNRFDIKNGKFRHFRHDPNNQNTISSDEIWTICEMPGYPGVLWIGTKEGLNRFDIKTESFKVFKHIPGKINTLTNNEVSALACSEDEPGILWVGTMGGGLNQMVISENDPEPDFYHLRKIPGKPGSISSDRIVSLYKNPRQPGILWVGTFESGLNKIYKSKKKIIHYVNDPENPNSLVNNVVWSILKDKNKVIWVGTHEGLTAILRDEEGQINYKNFRSDGSSSGLSNDIVSCIIESGSKSGEIWVGTYGGGLDKVSYKGNPDPDIRFKHYRNNPLKKTTLSSDYVLSLFESKYEDGIIWVGTVRGGLNKFDTKKEIFTSFRNEPGNPKSLSIDHVSVVIESLIDPDILWLGTLGGGLNKFDKKNKVFKTFKSDESDFNSISSDVILCLYQSPAYPETLWIGTAEGGLNLFDKKTETFKQYTTKDGLASNIVNGILEDEKGLFWISTNHGISVFDPENGTFRNYDVDDGLQDNEFNGNAVFKSSSGELFFGGMNGLNSFFPDQIKNNSNIPPVVLTDFKVFNRSVKLGNAIDSLQQYSDFLPTLDKIISELKEIKLSYKHNFFSFDFASLDYASPKKNQYAYMMEGFDEDWIYIGNRRYASYTNLDPGEYVFRVKGSNNDGIWNETGTSLNIIIVPPFWRTWWFLTGFWLLATISVLATVRYFATKKLKQQIEKLEHERELERERTRISRDMHDEVGTNLTEIAILSELVKQDVYKPDEAIHHLNSISSQIAEIIDNIGQIIWAINPKNDPLENLVSYIRNFAYNFLSKSAIKSNFEISEDISDFSMSAEVRRNLFLVIKESLNNIVKHSGADKVDIIINTLNSEFHVTIKDNGKGFTEGRKFGNGLSNMKKRVEDIGGSFSIKSELNQGTEINISLTLRQSNPH